MKPSTSPIQTYPPYMGGTIWIDLRNSFLWLGPFLQLIHALEVLTFMTAYSILHLLRNMAIDLWLSVVVYLLLCGFERGYRVLIIRRNNTDFMVSYLWTNRLVSTPRVGTLFMEQCFGLDEDI